MPEKTRLDKWLWAVRIFKTRTLAAEACRSGHVKIDGATCKPAHEVKVGEIITVKMDLVTKTLKVLGLLERRGGAAVAKEYVEDLTPPEEYEKAKAAREQPLFYRPKGLGRPTKKDRRALLGLKKLG